MNGFQLDTSLMIIAAVVTGVIVLLGVAKLSRFYLRFTEAKRDIEANLITLNGQLKLIQLSMTELVSEQRRQSRLFLEQLNLKRAEMTGDYEVIEETITDAPQAAAPSASPEPPSRPAGIKPLFDFGKNESK